MKNGMQVNMQFLVESLQKTCAKYIRHGEVRFDVDINGEEHINFENIMKNTLKGNIRKKYKEIEIIDSDSDLDDDLGDCIKFVPIDDIKNFYYNLPWCSIMCYYEKKKLHGVFIFNSMDETVIFTTTKEDDKNVRIYRNMSISNFRVRMVSRGLYNLSNVEKSEELDIIIKKEHKKIISFFSPTMAMLSIINGNLDGMVATIYNRELIHPICLIYQKLGVSYTFKNDIIIVV